MTAYDVDPYKGGESQVGWKIPHIASKHFNIILITRKNNKENILKYIEENKISSERMSFIFYDLPYFLRFWKRGKRGSGIYFYLWQLCIPIFIYLKKIDFDIAHSVNFVSDAYPHFLWATLKPTIWGPIAHHEKIYKDALKFYGRSALLKDRITWVIKIFLWKLDIFNFASRKLSSKILVSNQSVKKRLNLNNKNIVNFPSSAIDSLPLLDKNKKKDFSFLVVARAVPLKSIDIAIKAFIKFKTLNNDSGVTLNIIGEGSFLKELKNLTHNHSMQDSIKFYGAVNYDKLDNFYKQSSVFLCPSHEGGGMAVIEAMSYGLPVICFKNFGPGEAACDESAIRINYEYYDQSINKFYEAMDFLHKNPHKVSKMSDAAIYRVKNKFMWEHREISLRQIYNELI